MTQRENDKPLSCNECRFNIGRVCRRNPPDYAPNVGYNFPQLIDDCVGCFAGEPRVQRSCNNCGKRETFDCFLFNRFEITCHSNRDGWHCSDWEGVKE